jgi:hypothetical protein
MSLVLRGSARCSIEQAGYVATRSMMPSPIRKAPGETAASRLDAFGAHAASLKSLICASNARRKAGRAVHRSM